MDSRYTLGHEIDREKLRRLLRRSDIRGSLQLATHALLLVATGTLLFFSRDSVWRVPALLAHGIAINFLFCGLHESTHRTAFASRRMNDGVAWICGALLLLPAQYFRLFHFAHHRFTQDPARDPELQQPHAATLASYLWRVSGLPNWTRRLKATLRHALTGRVIEPFIPARQQPSIVREARILWGFYLEIVVLSLAFKSSVAWIYWILPTLVGQPLLRMYLLSEHVNCPQDANPFANTRTTYTNAVTRVLTWQMPFHVEHHAFPAVPFHALAAINREIRSRILVSAPGYLTLHRGVLSQFKNRRSSPGA